MDDIKDTKPDAAGEQHTGNHKPAGAPDQAGADRFGGTRAGAGNVEQPVTNIEHGTDVDRVAPLEEQRDDARNPSGPTLRQAERDEHGRI